MNPYAISNLKTDIITPEKSMLHVPMVTEQSQGVIKTYDLFSRLLKERIIMLCDKVTDASAQLIIGQLLYLEAEDPNKDIYLYINSPGGSVSAGLGIYDTMNFIKCDVSTVCIGMAASMGAFLLSSGAKGKRICLPNAEVMIHQPLGGAQGQASDMQIQCEHILRTKERLNRILCQNTGQDMDTMIKATDRDNWLTAEEAKAFGLIDSVQSKH